MKVNIFGKRVLVTKIIEDHSTVNGIYIGEVKVREELAVITQLGDMTDVKYEVGMTIIIDKYKGTEIETDLGTQFILEETDILGIVELPLETEEK